jgi:hypothetical protein
MISESRREPENDCGRFLIGCQFRQDEGLVPHFLRALVRAAACAAIDPHRIPRALSLVEFQAIGRLSVLRRELGPIMVIQLLTTISLY